MNQVTVECYIADNQRPINHFYRTENYTVSCNRNDTIWVAKRNNEIIASAFIRPYASYDKDKTLSLLRSLVVSSNHRQKGVAKKLMTALFSQNQPDVYTLCEVNLVHFYRSFGFHIVNGDADTSTRPTAWQKEIQKGLILLMRPCSV